MEAKEEKIRLRTDQLKIRKELENRSQKDTEILQYLLGSEWYRRAACIYTYVSCKGEVDTKRLILQAWEDGKRVAVPRVCGRDMDFFRITAMEDLESGIKGILEPRRTCEKAADADALMIVPGVAFDGSGHRIGYGGGFYDRYIKENPRHLRIALAYRCQVLKRIPSEPWDKTVNSIITEEGIRDESDRNGRKSENCCDGIEHFGKR